MTISIRHAPASSRNEEIKEVEAKEGESNLDWLKRAAGGEDVNGSVILLGGGDLEHFRVRCAQSRLRSDMLPSFWSLAGILTNERGFVSVTLEVKDVSLVPQTNGVRRCRLSDYADPKWFPNVAVLRFTDSLRPITDNIARVERQRSVIDLPSYVLPWLGHVWGTGAGDNPLVAGYGLPSAAFVETVFGLSGIELTPGLSSSSSCPEAIWSTALWWHDFYEARADDEARAEGVARAAAIPSAEEARAAGKASKAAKRSGGKAASRGAGRAEEADATRARARVPTGFFTVRQPAAYVEE
jgi:hypothetical protein